MGEVEIPCALKPAQLPEGKKFYTATAARLRNIKWIKRRIVYRFLHSFFRRMGLEEGTDPCFRDLTLACIVQPASRRKTREILARPERVTRRYKFLSAHGRSYNLNEELPAVPSKRSLPSSPASKKSLWKTQQQDKPHQIYQSDKRGKRPFEETGVLVTLLTKSGAFTLLPSFLHRHSVRQVRSISRGSVIRPALRILRAFG